MCMRTPFLHTFPARDDIANYHSVLMLMTMQKGRMPALDKVHRLVYRTELKQLL